MAIVLITRIVILLVIFLGALFCSNAIIGNEWRELEFFQGNARIALGLWRTCKEIKGLPNDCKTVKVSDLADANLECSFVNYLIFNLFSVTFAKRIKYLSLYKKSTI